MNEKINHVWIPQVVKLDEIHKNERFEIIRNDGYIFKDENGNVINAMKIVLEKKKKEYPKTYDDFVELVKRMREAQDAFNILVSADNIEDIDFWHIRMLELEREVDEYLKKMEEEL